MRRGSDNSVVAAVDDEFGSGEVRRGVGDEEGDELGGPTSVARTLL